MFKVFIFLVVLNALAGFGLYYYVSNVPHEPAVWHVDPLTEPSSPTPNSYRVAPPNLTDEQVDRVAPVYLANPSLMAKAFDDFVLSRLKVKRIAGSPEEGWMTYVQKSPKLNLPDYISVKFIDLTGGRSTVAIYSRSRFGHGDMGVNEARVSSWMTALESFEEKPGQAPAEAVPDEASEQEPPAETPVADAADAAEATESTATE